MGRGSSGLSGGGGAAAKIRQEFPLASEIDFPDGEKMWTAPTGAPIARIMPNGDEYHYMGSFQGINIDDRANTKNPVLVPSTGQTQAIRNWKITSVLKQSNGKVTVMMRDPDNANASIRVDRKQVIQQ